MKLELVVRIRSLAEFKVVSWAVGSKVSFRVTPVEKQEMLSLTPSRRANQTISDCLLRVFLRERSPIETVPRFERGCRKIVAIRQPDSLLANSWESRLEGQSAGLKAMAPSVIPLTPCESFSAFTIEVLLMAMRSRSVARKRLSPTSRVSSRALLESFAQNSPNSTFCSSPAIRSLEPTRTTSSGWRLSCCFPKKRALARTSRNSSAALAFSESSMILHGLSPPWQAGDLSQERGAVKSTATQQSIPSMKSCKWQLTSLKQHSSLQVRAEPDGGAEQSGELLAMVDRERANSLQLRTMVQQRRSRRIWSGVGVGRPSINW